MESKRIPSPLFDAIQAEDTTVEIFHQLFEENKTEEDLRNDDGRTLLHHACAYGRYALVKYLSTYYDINVYDNYFWTPLHTAASAGYCDIVEFLLCQPSTLVDPLNQNKASPLHYASSKGHLRIVIELVNHGADINLKDSNNHTPLMNAVCMSQEKVVEYFLTKKHIDMDVKENITQDNLLHISLVNKNLSIACMIYEKAPHLTSQCNYEGQCPADLATRPFLLAWKEIKEKTEGVL